MKAAMLPVLATSVLCFGEALGLILNPAGSRLRDSAVARLSFAGAESNVSIGLARLGCPATWLSAVGADPVGERVLRQLRQEGVDVAWVHTAATHPTALMLRDRPSWAEPSIYYWRNTSAFSVVAAEIVERIEWSHIRLVFLTGITPALNAGCRRATSRVVELAREHGVPVWLDVNHRRKLWSDDDARAALRPLVCQVTGLFASEDEARLITQDTASASHLGFSLLAVGPREVVLKLGARGAHAFDSAGDEYHPAFTIEREADPIGAGDAFNAGYLSGVLTGATRTEALRRGCACGALACLTDGDWEGLPSLAELERFTQRSRSAQR
jgi:2-dehydro-3-deoxygluconokinase